MYIIDVLTSVLIQIFFQQVMQRANLTASQRGDGEGRGGVRISLFWSQVVKLSQELPYPQWVRQVPRSKTKTPASYLCKLFYPT